MLQKKCACGGTAASSDCEECSKQDFTLQRSALDQNVRPHDDRVPRIVNQVLQSTGQPLDVQTRALMEPRFGHDFSNVRVHTDSRASESAHSVNALAYTIGTDVVFARQQYAPQTTRGLSLIAHELAHVVQQHGGSATGRSEHQLEREADVAAQSITSGRAPEVSAGIAPAQSPQFADPSEAHEPPKPTAQEYIAQHSNFGGANLLEISLASDLYMLAWESADHYQFVLEVISLLDAENQVEVVEAFFEQLKDDSFIEAFALRENGRVFLTTMVKVLSPRHSQRFRVEKIVKAGPQREVEQERTAALEHLEKQGKNADLTMYTSYEGEDLAESQLESIAQHQKQAGNTDEIFPMEDFSDIQGYLEALHQASGGVTDFVRELHLMGHGTEDNFGFGRYFYSSDNLREIPTGLNSLYMADGATIYLEGCNVAKGEVGRKYVAQIGRIFFGEKKTGFIKGNTCLTHDLMGVEMSECDPRTLRWPGDLKDALSK